MCIRDSVQFAHDPVSDRIVVIEINPRTSRSSALASKATGFPIEMCIRDSDEGVQAQHSDTGGKEMVIPQHVAIILDGNGRWAKSRMMPRNYGHVRGAQNLEVICEDAYKMGIKYLTVYLFSTENWKRPEDEVDALMKLFRSYTKTCVKTAMKNNMKVRTIGDPSVLDEDLRESLRVLEETSKDNTGLNFQIAINYEMCIRDRSGSH